MNEKIFVVNISAKVCDIPVSLSTATEASSKDEAESIAREAIEQSFKIVSTDTIEIRKDDIDKMDNVKILKNKEGEKMNKNEFWEFENRLNEVIRLSAKRVSNIEAERRELAKLLKTLDDKARNTISFRHDFVRWWWKIYEIEDIEYYLYYSLGIGLSIIEVHEEATRIEEGHSIKTKDFVLLLKDADTFERVKIRIKKGLDAHIKELKEEVEKLQKNNQQE